MVAAFGGAVWCSLYLVKVVCGVDAMAALENVAYRVG